MPVLAEAGQRPSGLRRSREGESGCKTNGSCATFNSTHHSILAPEEVGAAGHVKDQAVHAIGRGHGCEASEIMERVMKKGGIRFGQKGLRPKVRDLRPCVRQGHSGGQAQLLSQGIDRLKTDRAPDLVHQDKGGVRQRFSGLPGFPRQPVAGQMGKPDRQIPAAVR